MFPMMCSRISEELAICRACQHLPYLPVLSF
jgi:hypothetical protein